ncbi:hypothetical protein [Zunongwangia atlantica]|uniref:Uncharacterized protein n=1 Tax=Zunongwangia atlantica 22II14-10F7 TaxID=1185767 RepID=A0A1Y1SYM8_9FLAO|nr:hypothetical protein [Zunongwangia atlantica]ORL43672.1 hypothetical protein IIF7_19639 [Zunongwangia atlantica 22II14-10F7]
MLEIISNWFLRRRWLYLIVGYGAFAFLIFELSIPNIPEEAAPDYLKIEESYGPIVKTISGYIVNRFAGGTNLINVAIISIIIFYCLYLEKQRFESKGKTFNYFGFIQNIDQTFKEDEKD